MKSPIWDVLSTPEPLSDSACVDPVFDPGSESALFLFLPADTSTSCTPKSPRNAKSKSSSKSPATGLGGTDSVILETGSLSSPHSPGLEPGFVNAGGSVSFSSTELSAWLSESSSLELRLSNSGGLIGPCSSELSDKSCRASLPRFQPITPSLAPDETVSSSSDTPPHSSSSAPRHSLSSAESSSSESPSDSCNFTRLCLPPESAFRFPPFAVELLVCLSSVSSSLLSDDSTCW